MINIGHKVGVRGLFGVGGVGFGTRTIGFGTRTIFGTRGLHLGLGRVGLRPGLNPELRPEPRSVTRSFHSSPPTLDKRVEMGSKILNMVPHFLRPYTVNFIKNPVMNLSAFLILHELTALIPLIGLWYLFHKYQFLIPMDLPQWAIDKGTKILDSAMESFDFKGYSIHDKVKLIMEGAYSYVIVKALLPVRVVISFWLTPFFAKWIINPVTKVFRRGGKKGDNNKITGLDKAPEPATKKVNRPRL